MELKLDWANKDNANFYEKITIKTMQQYAMIAGLAKGADIDVIQSYIDNATSILEVGAGYGRVIDFLIKRKFKGEISAIERSSKLCNSIHSQFGDRINLYNVDIKKFNVRKKFDLILWLWGGILEFNKNEQLSVVTKLNSLLKKAGGLVVDTSIYSKNSRYAVNKKNLDAQTYVECFNHLKIYGYVPSDKEITKYFLNNKFDNVKKIEYQTSTNKKRNIYTLI